MIVDISYLFKKLILDQMKISHISFNVCVLLKSEIPHSIMDSIKKTFGNSFIFDADFILFFKKKNMFSNDGENSEFFSKDDLKKITGIIKRALGNIANNMNINEINILSKDSVSKIKNSESENSDGKKYVFIKITIKK